MPDDKPLQDDPELLAALGGVPGDVDITKLDETELTEDGAALVFERQYRGRLKFCHDAGKWYVWTGTHWKQNRDGLAFHWARELVRDLNRPSGLPTKEKTGRASFTGAVELFSRRSRAFAVTAEEWDPDDFLLGTPGGVVDLRTGELRPARPSDNITKITSVAPAEPGARCDRWLTFLDQATNKDDHLIRFLQRWNGYCLTGTTREHALLFIYGTGGNGKGVFLNTTKQIMGDYCETAPMDTFTSSLQEKHPTDLAGLRGARMVSASETEEGRAWAEARIKQMTGGDPISARFMRQDFFTYTPRFKLTFIGNYKPGLKNVDDAARRRFNMVPFIHKPREQDPLLSDALMEEAPAILRWMIDGCLEWQRDGLVRPDTVANATNEYFETEDAIGRWMAERCKLDVNLETKPGHLLLDLQEWSQRNGEPIADNRRLRGVLERTPGCKYVMNRGARSVRGIGLNPHKAHHQESAERDEPDACGAGVSGGAG